MNKDYTLNDAYITCEYVIGRNKGKLDNTELYKLCIREVIKRLGSSRLPNGWRGNLDEHILMYMNG